MAALTSPVSPLPTLLQTAPFLDHCNLQPSWNTDTTPQQVERDQTDFQFSRAKQSSSKNLDPGQLAKKMTTSSDPTSAYRLFGMDEDDGTTALVAEMPNFGRRVEEKCCIKYSYRLTSLFATLQSKLHVRIAHQRASLRIG